MTPPCLEMDQQFCNPLQLTSAGNSVSYRDFILPLDTLNIKELEMLLLMV